MIAPLNPGLTSEQRLRLELESARAALEAEIAARRRIEAALLATLDAERERLGTILHDTACQSLNGICFLSRIIRRKLEQEPSPYAEDILELADAVDDAVREMQTIAHEFEPVDGEQMGLLSGLSRVCETSCRGIACDVHCSEEIPHPDSIRTAHLLKITRQAIVEARSRAGVSRITVTLSMQNRLLALMIQDDGAADTLAAESGPLDGVEMMRLRAAAIGAALTHTQTNRGTTITCILALPS